MRIRAFFFRRGSGATNRNPSGPPRCERCRPAVIDAPPFANVEVLSFLAPPARPTLRINPRCSKTHLQQRLT